MRIGVDLDGVLYPWTECANAALVERFGIPDPGEHQRWNWLKGQVTREQWSWLWSADGQDAAFGRFTLSYPGVVEAFSSILKSGHEVHFVTHRDPRRTAIHTANFLSWHFGSHPWAGLHVMGGGAKHALMDWDVFVDDRSDTVMDFLIQTRAQVFAPVRPWNAELNDVVLATLAHEPRLIYYDDPREVSEWVLAQ